MELVLVPCKQLCDLISFGDNSKPNVSMPRNGFCRPTLRSPALLRYACFTSG